MAEVARVLVLGGHFVVLDVRMMSALPRWLHWMSHICAVDSGHQTIDVLRRVVATLEVRTYPAGAFYITVVTAAATKS